MIVRPRRGLQIGVKDDVANFGLYDAESGRYSGMEIDLAKQLSEDLGYGQPELISVSATTREEMQDRRYAQFQQRAICPGKG